jgi:hypothetical protein
MTALSRIILVENTEIARIAWRNCDADRAKR